jgi:hypothetical protein
MEEKVERLTADDLLYLQETVEEVTSLQNSANTLANFCQARLAKKYGLINGCSMDQKTGIIIRPRPQRVQDEKPEKDPNQSNKEG